MKILNLLALGLSLQQGLLGASPIQNPGAPQELKADFELQSQTAKAQIGVRLQWLASEAGTYLIKRYALQRRTFGEADFLARQPQGDSFLSTRVWDEAELGQTYEYRVAAIDARGNSSLPSIAVSINLNQVDVAILAPRAPQGLTAQSGRDRVTLAWENSMAFLDPITSYQVARSAQGQPDFEAQGLTQSSYLDLSPPSKVLYTYQVRGVDSKGRVSPWSLTVAAQATGTLPPGMPRALTVKAKADKISLEWEAAPGGTAPVTRYIVRRVALAPNGNDLEFKDLKPLESTRSSYSESVEAERSYRYELRAIDSEGNTSLPASGEAFVPGKQLNKTAIMLMPTAFSNLAKSDLGWNLNVLFDFYIGSLYETFTDEKTGKTDSAFAQRLYQGAFTLDLKYSFLSETRFTPGIAAGFYTAAQVGSASSGTINVSSSGGGLNSVGNIYVVASKRFAPRAAIHAGYMRGDLAAGITGLAPPDWELTLRHLLPGGDYPSLLTRLVDPSLGASVASAPDMAFVGLQFPFTLPLGFTRWRSGLRIEALKPIIPNTLVGTHEAGTEALRSALPLMINFKFDNLPTFGLEFAIFQFRGGWEWIAYYHLPDLTWAW